MVKVCVHYPLSPKSANECMEKMFHKEKWIDDLALPFSKSSRMTAWALSELEVAGEISEKEHRELYDQFVKGRRSITIQYFDEPAVNPDNPFHPDDPRYRSYLHGSMMQNRRSH